MLPKLIIWCCLAAAPVASQPNRPQSPPDGSPKVELKGTIEQVRIAAGQGMPYLELRDSKGLHRVMLGSMRYLFEHNFNPKAGLDASVKGFQVGDLVLAQSVSLTADKITIQLRDDDGVPLWRMGRYGWRRN
ncbi:hypothetical protein [uncultured Paludibaculum sp.]|uniref:hypothetical protein n=1 Tax=uncultured Paludibaculum sp. TaxID=1765020 RepID=UPI002AAAE85B|nr:hypothetical protein [uncultured Paludibaculum sp.]